MRTTRTKAAKEPKLTREDLDRLRRLLDKSTQGRWFYDACNGNPTVVVKSRGNGQCDEENLAMCRYDQDAKLIVAMRKFLPVLLDIAQSDTRFSGRRLYHTKRG